MPTIVSVAKRQKTGLNKKVAYVQRVLTYSKIDFDTFLQHVSADSGLSEAVASVAVGAINKQIMQMLFNGHSFPIGNLFYLRYSFNCKEKNNAADLTARDIYRRRILARPAKNFSEDLKSVRKEIVVQN